MAPLYVRFPWIFLCADWHGCLCVWMEWKCVCVAFMDAPMCGFTCPVICVDIPARLHGRISLVIICAGYVVDSCADLDGLL